MLQISDLTAGYGSLSILRQVSLQVGDGEFVAVIGPNGAGKSTLLRAIMGSCQVMGGDVRLGDVDLRGLRAKDRASAGVGYVPEGRRIWPSMTVRDNLIMGGWTLRPKRRGPVTEAMDQVLTTFPRLKERIGTRAGMLSGGEQQMVALGRALMSNPRIMLIDEPSTGLAPVAIDAVVQALQGLHTHGGLSVLLVEQRLDVARALCTHGFLLNRGEVRGAGSLDELTDAAELGYFTVHEPEPEA
jgi:branched-chain amino acid transport system ATP-binding protein